VIKMMFYKETNFKETLIGNIPQDWELVRLYNIAEDIYYGITAKAVGNKTELKMLRTTEIKDYNVNWDALPFCEITEKRGDVQRFLLKKGDLIIARAGTTGVSILVEKDFENVIFGSYLIKVKLIRKVHPKFIHYFCQSRLYWNHISSSQAGSTLKNISLPVLKSLNVPLPPLIEQQKIAEILSTVDVAIQKTDEIIAKTERLKEGLMQELLTKGIGHNEFKDTEIGRIPKEWEVITFKDITKQFISGGTPSTKNPKYWNGDIPWIRSIHLKRYYIDETSIERYITKEGLENSASNIVPKGNIIIATRVGIGKAAVNLIDVAINQDLTGLVIDKSKTDPLFLVWYLLSPKILSLLESFTRGTTIKGIAQNYVKNLLIPLPPINEQRRIVEILLAVDKKLEIERKEKARLERIKQGLMDLLLTGKVRVRV